MLKKKKKKKNPLILASVSNTFASIVDGSIGTLPHTNPRVFYKIKKL
jgi:hypothetical protein